jgi:uncharacterized protein (DUF302 family)
MPNFKHAKKHRDYSQFSHLTCISDEFASVSHSGKIRPPHAPVLLAPKRDNETRAALTDFFRRRGFGVFTQIDVTDTLHQKIGVDFRSNLILGAYNPKTRLRGPGLEDTIGTTLPCNVIVQRHDEGAAENDPVASMSAIDNPNLGKVAGEVRKLLKQAVTDIASLDRRFIAKTAMFVAKH